jgi:hypothetical protein
MLRLHCTKKLLDRIGVKPSVSPVLAADSGTHLATWYATMLSWKPQVALLVNERTLLPVLMPLAPAKTLATRFPAHLATVLTAHRWLAHQIDAEIRQLNQHQLLKTANRSVLGSLNDFTFLAEVHKQHDGSDDLPRIALALANAPCAPIRYQSPSDLITAIGASGAAMH